MAITVAYIERYFELKGVPFDKAYFTRRQLVLAIVSAFLGAQGLASIVLSLKLFAVGDMAVLFLGTVVVLLLSKGPAEYFMKRLMPLKKKGD